MELSLSEEQKRRIEQEEAVRIAEERYRDEVRRSMRPPTPRPESRINWPAIGIALVLIVAAGISVGLFLSAFSHTRPLNSFQTRWVPMSASLVDGQFQVPAQNYRAWTIEAPGGIVRNYHVIGHYSAIGGGGNDIEAVIASEDEFQNWINGHQARAFYSTPGRVTTGKIDVVLPPGRYVLAFNNRFSLLTPKAISLKIGAVYEQQR